ncbi:MAG: hydroxyacid dehydrogenase [Pseudomonadota bacterium]
MDCLLIQPIHPDGITILEEAGLTVRQASEPTMACVIREVGDAVAAITRNAGFSQDAMVAAGALKVLGNHGIGLDPVDTDYAREIGLPIVYTPHANVQSVAEQALAQMMAVAKRVREADSAVRAGRFDYRYTRDFVELFGKTLLIVGFGTIGKHTAELAAKAFGMRILVHSPHADRAAVETSGFVPADDLDAALGEADVVSLHQRLTPATRGLFNAARLRAMKPGAILVNTARGGIVETDALVEAVSSGHLRGAAMDVFETEPLPADHPFTRTPGIVLSPHIGGATEEALVRTAVETAQQVVDVLNDNKPPHLVDDSVWERRRHAGVKAPA